MKKFEKATLEIVYFECNDIITTSGEHDNGYVDGGDLAYLAQDVKNAINKIIN